MTTRIALLGTGLMGAPMARNLLKAGYPVTVWNRTRQKAEALEADGARVAATAAEAAAEAEVVVTMLESGPIVGQVLFEQGVAEALRSGAAVIDMSSIPPRLARRHAERLAERGIAQLDAPVSGGTGGAAAGTLAIMVGGKESDFERLKTLFEPLGNATYVGPSGAGQLAKLANQIIVGVTIGAVAEALLLASAGGADPGAVRNALRGGFADSRILTEHGRRMLERNFVPGGAVHNQLKDLDTALDAAAELGLTLPILTRVRELYRQLRDGGSGDLDHSALLLELERMNPPRRMSTAPDR